MSALLGDPDLLLDFVAGTQLCIAVRTAHDILFPDAPCKPLRRRTRGFIRASSSIRCNARCLKVHAQASIHTSQVDGEVDGTIAHIADPERFNIFCSRTSPPIPLCYTSPLSRMSGEVT